MKMKQKNNNEEVSELWSKYSPKSWVDNNGLPAERLVPLKEGVVLEDLNVVTSVGENHFRTSYLAMGLRVYIGGTQRLNKYRYLPDIKGIFENQVVVDLGAGATSLGYELANLTKAKCYVGVEPDSFNRASLKYNILEFFNKLYDKRLIPFSLIELDMLSFLENLKDDSVSMIVGGIDRDIIHDENYRKPLEKEIQRTLSPSGGLLSFYSDIYKPSNDKITTLGYQSPYSVSDTLIMRK